jgi:hypothetical protein
MNHPSEFWFIGVTLTMTLTLIGIWFRVEWLVWKMDREDRENERKKGGGK